MSSLIPADICVSFDEDQRFFFYLNQTFINKAMLVYFLKKDHPLKKDIKSVIMLMTETFK